jgi:hypothetical protein
MKTTFKYINYGTKKGQTGNPAETLRFPNKNSKTTESFITQLGN